MQVGETVRKPLTDIFQDVDKAYIEDITRRMNEQNFSYEYINENNKLFEILI